MTSVLGLNLLKITCLFNKVTIIFSLFILFISTINNIYILYFLFFLLISLLSHKWNYSFLN